MSGDFNGPFSLLAQEFQRHAARTPPQKAFARTSYGSLILAACAYTAVTLGPDALHQYPTTWLLGYAATVCFSLMLFIVGIRGPRMPADVMTYFWSLFWAAAFGAGSWWLAVYQPDWWDNIYLRGFCLSFACAQGLEFLLLLRPGAGNAEGMVRRQIERNRVDMRPANGRR
jgi:hypothetical protein